MELYPAGVQQAINNVLNQSASTPSLLNEISVFEMNVHHFR